MKKPPKSTPRKSPQSSGWGLPRKTVEGMAWPAQTPIPSIGKRKQPPSASVKPAKQPKKRPTPNAKTRPVAGTIGKGVKRSRKGAEAFEKPEGWETSVSEGPKGWEAGEGDLTRRDTGRVFLSELEGFKGRRKEESLFAKSPTGRMKPEEWQKLVNSIRKNGVTEPVTIHVEKDGRVFVYEGNHRIRAAAEAGVSEIPAEISYFGNSQRKGLIVTPPTMEAFQKPLARPQPPKSGKKLPRGYGPVHTSERQLTLIRDAMGQGKAVMAENEMPIETRTMRYPDGVISGQANLPIASGSEDELTAKLIELENAVIPPPNSWIRIGFRFPDKPDESKYERVGGRWDESTHWFFGTNYLRAYLVARQIAERMAKKGIVIERVYVKVVYKPDMEKPAF